MRMNESQFIDWMKKYHRHEVQLSEGIDMKGYNVRMMTAIGQIKEQMNKMYGELSRDNFSELAAQLKTFQDKFEEWNGNFSGFMTPAIKVVDDQQQSSGTAGTDVPSDDIQQNNALGGDQNNG